MNDSELKAEATRRFMWAVQALALPALQQRQLFPQFAEVADELALDYEEAWRTYSTVLEPLTSPAQQASVAALTELLQAMSGSQRLWTDEALETAAEWGRVRELAGGVLQAMAWPHEAPPADRAIYVGPPGSASMGS